MALLAGLTHAQSTDAPPPAGSTVAEGRRVYVRSCEVCHGPAGAGALGPALKRVGQRLSAQQLEEQIKNPKGSMPRLYPAAVSAEDVDRLVAYLHQL
ncbi:MAG TPA: cytochrome c [Methylibium sp.]|nr:cytochrome c [Methylibium sp.]